ncbi:MAG TPA: DUF6766 family protein [Verrucomicrobiae bacterium]|nr:DUF6766 family protein [Verrucomicrobiae bacterium]
MSKNSPLTKYGYLWVTTAFFLLSLIGHWVFAWPAYVEEQNEHSQPIEVSGYFTQTARDTLENWQSEFLQLMWQVAGLSFLLFIGSPQSKESDDRKEEKIDAILKAVDKNGDEIINKLDSKYQRSA